MEFEKIPCDVWDNALTPWLDRVDWNALLVAYKPFYELAKTNSIAPPWPTKCFGIRGSQAITSFTMSYDSEYLAAGSTLGSIDIWSRRKGKITSLRKRETLTSRSRLDGNQSSGQRRRSQPIGSVLKFAPHGYTLASAHENRIFLQEISDSPSEGGDAQHPCQVLEVECRHGTIYEVTYLEFSNDCSQLIARYGKTAFIWKRAQPAPPTTCGSLLNASFVLVHKFPLSSSRCQMTSSPCLKFVAVTSAGSAEEKGTIDVWSVDSNGSSTADGKSLSCTTIQAHEKKTIRGLKFVVDTDNQGLLQMKDHHFLLSATLQGEVKVWRYQVHRINDCCNDFDATLSTSTSYMCTRTIKVPGKIFSLAVYAPSLFGLVTKEDVYLAMGQSRGQVRVMRINLWSHEKDETVDRSALHNSSSGNETSNLIRSASSSNTEDREDSTINENSSSNDALQDFLSLDVVGEQSHHDNIKLLTFSPDGRHLVASRAYDARIWFHSFQVNNDSR